jgi:streptomycin 6-kinase
MRPGRGVDVQRFDRAGLAERVRNVYGGAGFRWAVNLESTAAQVVRRWQLVVHRELTSGYSFVAQVSTADARPMILKLGFPGSQDLRREASLLDGARGRGYSALIRQEPSAGALLLERLDPGQALTMDAVGPRPADAVAVAATIKGMWHGPDAAEPLPSSSDWCADLDKVLRGSFGPPAGFEFDDIRHAAALAAALQATASGSPLVLHGDLHHGNVLSDHQNGYRAIDPKGVRGELAYEAGASLRNPYPELAHVAEPAALLRRRCEVFATDLELPYHRIVLWGWVQLVLSAVWGRMDRDADWQAYARACAPAFRALAAEQERYL